MQKTDISSQRHEGTITLRPCLAALALSAGMMLMVGCDRDQVSHATTPKGTQDSAGSPSGQAPAPMGAMPPANMPPGAMPPANMPPGQLAPPPRPTGNGVLKWTLPKGWTETPGSGMRFATLTPPGPGKAELSVVVLPGPAGGELANVNRWRGQIGLAPIDEKALGLARKTVKSKAGPVSLYDFTSEGQLQTRMVTGLLSTRDGNTWFLKLVGEAVPVGKAKPDFMRLLEALHLD